MKGIPTYLYSLLFMQKWERDHTGEAPKGDGCIFSLEKTTGAFIQAPSHRSTRTASYTEPCNHDIPRGRRLQDCSEADSGGGGFT